MDLNFTQNLEKSFPNIKLHMARRDTSSQVKVAANENSPSPWNYSNRCCSH